MPSMYATNTNSLTTVDWLKSIENMKLSAFEPIRLNEAPSEEGVYLSGIFGTHVKEAVAIVKDWIEDSKQ